MLGVDQIAIIRHKILAEGRSVRSVAAELGVSRNTVRRAVRSAPAAAKPAPRRARTKSELAEARIDALLGEWDGRTTPKQRLTGTRVHRQLRTEGLDVGITTVRLYLAQKRRAAAEVYIPLVHRPGGSGQVDFFAVQVLLAGQRRMLTMFQMSLPYSDRDYARLYEHEDLPAFLDAHVRAFEYFGGAPGRLVYDNTRLAVDRISGRERVLNAFFQRLVAHFAFEADFARVGTGHDKGAIEVRGKRSRLSHLVPVPEGDSLAAINAALLAELEAAAATRRNVAGRTVAERFAEEAAQLIPLPAEPFEARLPARVSVNASALVRLGNARYSVPSHWARQSVMAWIGPEDIRFEHRAESVMVRREAAGGQGVRYLHYLPELATKPKALRQVAPELMAELGGVWPALWERLETVHGAAKAGRVVASLLAVYLAGGPAELEGLLSGVVQPAEPEAPAPTTVAVPAALAHVAVEQTPATAYDRLLAEARR